MENCTVLTTAKKAIAMKGTVVFPLTVGSRALVLTDMGTLTTSTVTAIEHIGPMEIGFETLNSHYMVTLTAPLQAVCAN